MSHFLTRTLSIAPTTLLSSLNIISPFGFALRSEEGAVQSSGGALNYSSAGEVNGVAVDSNNVTRSLWSDAGGDRVAPDHSTAIPTHVSGSSSVSVADRSDAQLAAIV